MAAKDVKNGFSAESWDEAEEERSCLLAARHRMEVWLGWLLLAGLGLLVFCQAGLYYDRSRITETWYGEDYAAEQVEVIPTVTMQAMNDNWGSVTLALVDYSQLDAAKVLINGQTAGSFKEAELTLQVFEADELAVDCTAYSQPVRVRLKRASAGIDRSSLLAEAVAVGDVISWGKIAFKDDNI